MKLLFNSDHLGNGGSFLLSLAIFSSRDLVLRNNIEQCNANVSEQKCERLLTHLAA